MTERRLKIDGVSGLKRTAGAEPEAVRVRVLGGFSVSVGNRTIEQNEWPLRKAASLIKLLALAPGHRLHREQAMDMLWPDLGRTAASNNLRQVLHAARRTLGPDPPAGSRYLVSEEESLALSPEGQLWVDAGVFEEAAKNARSSGEPTAYEAALTLYSGELLPGDRYEEWAEEHRRRLREIYLSLLLGLARLHEERANHDSATEVLRRVVSEEPTREEAHVGLMRLHALSGREGDALAQYERLEEILLKELGIEPAASSRALKEEIAAGRFPPGQTRSPGSPPEETPGASRHNLPAARSSFVGREREMREVRRELAMTRLLTLTGAGGTGKTRLALEAARGLIGAYQDGVWLVEFAPLSGGELVAQAVAGTLGIREQPGYPLVDTLLEELRLKQMLLILDNCEHLVEAAARLVDTLLDSCARLRILATSREALKVEGEVRWPVAALSVPDPQRHLGVEELEGYEAVRLFAERARRRDPSFTLTAHNAETVAQVCRKVEGIPLAIELAAARVGTLSVDQISERLENSVGLLAGGGRTAVPRQRTLGGAMDWSHELLSEGEKKLFGRLSVFAGGWTLEATGAVSSDEGIREGDVLELLSGLVDKSLVVAEATEDGSVRYRMLEPIRQYALEKLEESGGAEEARRRHASYYLALAQEAEPELRGPQQGLWLDRLETEHDNFRTALSWSIERGDAELYLRLAGALWKFWDARGYYNEARHWFEEVLAKDDRAAPAARAKVLEALGWLTYDQGDMDRAGAAAEEGLELGAEAEVGVAAGLRLILGYVADMRGDYERATQLHEEALALGREAGHTRTVAGAILGLGAISVKRGDHERATELFEEGLALSRELADTEIIPYYLINLGYECLLQGDHERARALNEEAAALYQEQGRRGDLQTALDNLGWAALLREDHERAKTFFEESLKISRDLGTRLVASESMEGVACVAGARGEAERAARLFAAAQELREAVGYEQPPGARALREPYQGAARSLLEEEAWEAAFADGRTLTLEEALEYALSEEAPATSAPPAPGRPSPDEPPAALTRREREVADLLAQGLTNRHIAKELFISERTVDHHVEKILKKLKLRSREQVASRLGK